MFLGVKRWTILVWSLSRVAARALGLPRGPVHGAAAEDVPYPLRQDPPATVSRPPAPARR